MSILHSTPEIDPGLDLAVKIGQFARTCRIHGSKAQLARDDMGAVQKCLATFNKPTGFRLGGTYAVLTTKDMDICGMAIIQYHARGDIKIIYVGCWAQRWLRNEQTLQLVRTCTKPVYDQYYKAMNSYVIPNELAETLMSSLINIYDNEYKDREN